MSRNERDFSWLTVYCCDRKSWAACAQSFALWQQATIEITLLLLVRATHIYRFALHAHPVRGEPHNQRNTTGQVATLPVRLSWSFVLTRCRVLTWVMKVLMPVIVNVHAWRIWPMGRRFTTLDVKKGSPVSSDFSKASEAHDRNNHNWSFTKLVEPIVPLFMQ